MSPAAERLRYILSEDDDMPTPTLFTEMDTLQREGDELEWKESARWMTLKQTTEGKYIYKTNCVLFLVGWFRMSSCKKKATECKHKMKDNFPAAGFIACLKCIQHYNFVGMEFQRNNISKLEKENWKRKYVEIMIEFTFLNTALWVCIKIAVLVHGGGLNCILCLLNCAC